MSFHIRWAVCCLPLFLAACAGRPALLPPLTGDKPVAATTQPAPLPPPSGPSEQQVMAAVDEQNSVFFPPSGTAIDAEGRRKLGELAQRLKADPDAVVTLVGHTDDLGSPSYNLAIAEQRVNAVYAVLRSQGVALTQIRRYGVGHEMSAPSCRSAACRRTMRRVEWVVER